MVHEGKQGSEKVKPQPERRVAIPQGKPTTFPLFTELPKEMQSRIFSLHAESYIETSDSIWALKGPDGHSRQLYDVRRGPDSFFFMFDSYDACLGTGESCNEIHLPASLEVSVLARQATLEQLWKIYNSESSTDLYLTRLMKTLLKTKDVELHEIKG